MAQPRRVHLYAMYWRRVLVELGPPGPQGNVNGGRGTCEPAVMAPYGWRTEPRSQLDRVWKSRT